MRKFYIKSKDLNYFKDRVQYWADILGCVEKQIIVDKKNAKNLYARASYQVSDDIGIVHIDLNTIQDVPYTQKDMDKTAFHEVFEAFYLAPLRFMAQADFRDCAVDEATHQAVYRAQSTIYERLK